MDVRSRILQPGSPSGLSPGVGVVRIIVLALRSYMITCSEEALVPDMDWR